MNSKDIYKLCKYNLKNSNIKLTDKQFKNYYYGVSYWTNRKQQDEDKNFQQALKVEKRMKKFYDNALVEIKNTLVNTYAKYANDKKVIDYASMKKRLTADEMKEFRVSLNNYFQTAKEKGMLNGTAGKSAQAYMKELSKKATISRLEALRTNIESIVSVLDDRVVLETEKSLMEATEKTYQKTFEEAKLLNNDLSFETPSDKFLKRMVLTNLQEKNFVERTHINNRTLIQVLEDIIPKAFITGDSIDMLTKKLTKRIDISYNDARRIVRTEMNRVTNQASLQAYKDAGVSEEFQYLATDDERTCVVCGEFNMKIFETKYGESGLNVPPLHPNCRCTIIPYFKPDELSEQIAPLNPRELRKWAAVNDEEILNMLKN